MQRDQSFCADPRNISYLKDNIQEGKSSGFSRIVTYAKKVMLKWLRLQMKNLVTKKCLNSYCLCNLSQFGCHKDSDRLRASFQRTSSYHSLQDCMDGEAVIQLPFSCTECYLQYCLQCPPLSSEMPSIFSFILLPYKPC